MTRQPIIMIEPVRFLNGPTELRVSCLYSRILELSRRLARRFVLAQRGAAAVEFALSSMWLFLFMFAIINLGDLGFTLSALQHAVEGAARDAAVSASADLSGTSALTCPNGAAIQNDFNKYASPGLPPAGSSGGPVLTPSASATTAWTTGTTLPGQYLKLTATYTWRPIGFPTYLGRGIPLSITTVSFVMGTNGKAACSD